MQHVTARTVSTLFEAISKVSGLKANELLASAPVAYQRVLSHPENAHWDEFVDLMDWLDETYALDWRSVGEACHGAPSLPPVAKLMRTALSLKFAYWVAFKWLGPSSFPLIRAKAFTDISKNQFSETLEMADHFRPSYPLFQIFSGMIETVPSQMFGLKPAFVETKISGSQVSYEVTLPEQILIWSWIRNRFLSVFSIGTLLDELAHQQQFIHDQNLTILGRQEEFKNLIDHFPDGVIICRYETIQYVNPRMVNYLGYQSSKELIGRSISEIMHPDHWPFVKKRVVELMSENVQLNPPREFTFKKKSGELFVTESAGVPITFHKERAISVVARDLTDRKKLQAHLMLSDRMMALGRLAAGVGHEINNPLFYVSMNIEKLSEELKSQKAYDFDERISSIQNGLDRIRNIVRDLKTVSQSSDDEKPTNVDLNSVLGSALNMARNEIQHRAVLKYEPKSLPPVWINETRLAQVLLNIMINAAQSIRPGKVDENEIEVKTYLNGKSEVVVEIRDTGAGMTDEVKSRIFDPFYTTKPVGEGTGLGLSICHSIVSSFQGKINFESEVGIGTVFRVSFPASRKKAVNELSIIENDKASVRGRVLLIDDEEELLEIMQDLLLEYHDCVVVSDARQALELFEKHENFDCILCDLMMPKMSGIEFFERLKKVSPEHLAKTVFMTGGSFTRETNQFLQDPMIRYCEKPIDADKLLGVIQKMVLKSRPLEMQ